MKKLQEMAAEFLRKNHDFNEVTMSDGKFTIRVVRYSPSNICTATGYTTYSNFGGMPHYSLTPCNA